MLLSNISKVVRKKAMAQVKLKVFYFISEFMVLRQIQFHNSINNSISAKYVTFMEIVIC